MRVELTIEFELGNDTAIATAQAAICAAADAAHTTVKAAVPNAEE